MKKPTIVTTRPLHPENVARALRACAKVVVAKDRPDFERQIAKADAIITYVDDPVAAPLLSKAPSLRVVGNYAVGVNNIDLRTCARRGIPVVNTPDVLTRATAELTLALLLAAARRLPEGEQMCRRNQFKGWAPDMLLGQELEGRRALLVGKGRIGSETAKLFRGIGLKVDWITRKDTASEIAKKLRQAQILSLHIPLNEDNYHWLNAERIRLLPRECIVLNSSRGPLIDERALIDALKNRRIFAAGLDVYEHEPKIPAGLKRLPNVVLLPHLGSATARAREGMALMVVQGVLEVLGGKRPRNQVDFDLDLYGP